LFDGFACRFFESRDRSVVLVRESGLFDQAWYLAENPDVAAAGRNPVVHYLRFGFREGREPGPDFDTAFYLSQAPEAGSGEVAPLLHYLTTGRSAGLKPRPMLENSPPWLVRAPGQPHRRSLEDVGEIIGQLRADGHWGLESLAAETPDRPRILFVISTRAGGTPMTNQDLMTALAATFDCLVLHCTRRSLVLEYFAEGIYTKLDHHVLHAPIEPIPHRSDEYDQVVFRWLLEWQISLLHVRHIAWHGLGLVDMAGLVGVPVVFSFHDYYTLCPTVKLLDDRAQFCGGVCTSGAGDCTPEDLWPAEAFDRLKHAQIRVWQAQFATMLSRCDAFVTTTDQVRHVILGSHPEAANTPFQVIPHGRDFPKMESMACAPSNDQALRVLFPGDLTRAKGADIIIALAGLVGPDRLAIHVLGAVSAGIDLPPDIICHGPYKRDEFQARVAEIQPHVGAVLSIWPETWCHTLTELWAAGVPVMGFDIGAVGERLRRSGAGWIIPEMTAAAVAGTLELARQPEAWARAVADVARWQNGEGAKGGCRAMAASYLDLYGRLSDRFRLENATHADRDGTCVR
jgi:glycosyltransferase involved in cell wall biosynthesis